MSESDDELDLAREERALDETPVSPEMAALEDRAAAHYARLNVRLRELSVEEAHKYLKLRNRVGSLLFFLTHEPHLQNMIERGTRMVAEALADIDPYYATRGLSPEDYARYRDLDAEYMDRAMERIFELEQEEEQTDR